MKTTSANETKKALKAQFGMTFSVKNFALVNDAPHCEVSYTSAEFDADVHSQIKSFIGNNMVSLHWLAA